MVPAREPYGCSPLDEPPPLRVFTAGRCRLGGTPCYGYRVFGPLLPGLHGSIGQDVFARSACLPGADRGGRSTTARQVGTGVLNTSCCLKGWLPNVGPLLDCGSIPAPRPPQLAAQRSICGHVGGFGMGRASPNPLSVVGAARASLLG